MRAAILALLTAGLVAGTASAQTGRIQAYGGPSFIATAYSNDPSYVDNADAPNLRARTGFAAPLMKEAMVVGPLIVDPKLAMVWEARRWPGGGSDPWTIGENNEYRPRMGFDVMLKDYIDLVLGLKYTGFSAWPIAHASNGQGADDDSRSMNTGQIDNYFEAYGFKVTVTGWYLYDADQVTMGLTDYLDFAFAENVGGQVSIERTFRLRTLWQQEHQEDVRPVWIKATFTLTSQDFEMTIPLIDYLDSALYLWAHNGEADGMVNYWSDHFVGGAGLAAFSF